MVWIRSDSSLAYHRKLDKLSMDMRMTRREAVGSLHLLWWWAAEHSQDGLLPRLTDVQIAAFCDHQNEPERFVATLVETGFIDKTPDGLRIHDWEQWLSDPVAEKIRYKQRKNTGKTAENSGSVHPSSSLVVLSFPVSGETKEWLLREDYVGKLRELYPGVDILLQAKRALNWVETNPTRKKTPRGMASFLARWMERTQNSGRGFSKAIPVNDQEIIREKWRGHDDRANRVVSDFLTKR